MLKYLKKWGRAQQGQTLAEFALVFPILMVFLLACLEFGWYFLNYNAVTQYTTDTLSCVPQPVGRLDWEYGEWKDTSVSTPSWMTAEDVAAGYHTAYKGWIAFEDKASYFHPTFEQNVSKISTLLNQEQIEISSVRGGWLATPMGQYRPMSGMRPTEEQRYARVSVYRYADIEVEVTYTFRPLTAMGEMFFCKDGEDTCQMVVKERAEIDMGQSLNMWGS